MTSTKKAPGAKASEEARDAIAKAYVQATEKRVRAERALNRGGSAKKTAIVAVDAPPPIDTKEKKLKEKIKGKDKKKKGKKKEAVIIRFEDSQLAGIDANADALGLSRAAWVRMVVARALGK